MSRKYIRALWATLLHGAVLMGAHTMAERSGEIAALVRDEWIVNAIDKVVATSR